MSNQHSEFERVARKVLKELSFTQSLHDPTYLHDYSRYGTSNFSDDEAQMWTRVRDTIGHIHEQKDILDTIDEIGTLHDELYRFMEKYYGKPIEKFLAVYKKADRAFSVAIWYDDNFHVQSDEQFRVRFVEYFDNNYTIESKNDVNAALFPSTLDEFTLQDVDKSELYRHEL